MNGIIFRYLISSPFSLKKGSIENMILWLRHNRREDIKNLATKKDAFHLISFTKTQNRPITKHPSQPTRTRKASACPNV